MLDYEVQMFLDILNEDGLVVTAKGLSIENVFLNLLKVYSDPGNLVLVLGTSTQEERYYITQLEKQGVFPLPRIITSESGSSTERMNVYLEGGVLFVSPRILVVDLLKDRLPVAHVTGVFVYRAQSIIKSCQEAFAIRLYRQKNKTGFIKAFSSSAQALTAGFAQVSRIMRMLFLKSIFLWPRFQAIIQSTLSTFKPKVTEMHVQLTPAMTRIQNAILDLMSFTVKEVKRINPAMDLDELTVENAIAKSFHKVLQLQLDPYWHQLSSKTKALVADLKVFRVILNYLIRYDCVTFNSFVSTFRSHSYAVSSTGWLLLDSANVLFTVARQRVLGEPVKPKAADANKDTGQGKKRVRRQLVSSDTEKGDSSATDSDAKIEQTTMTTRPAKFSKLSLTQRAASKANGAQPESKPDSSQGDQQELLDNLKKAVTPVKRKPLHRILEDSDSEDIDDVEEEASKPQGQKTEGQEMDPEPSPKWMVLKQILSEIKETSRASKREVETREKVLILVEDKRTAKQLQDFLVLGAREMLLTLYRKSQEKKKTSVLSDRGFAEQNTRSPTKLFQKFQQQLTEGLEVELSTQLMSRHNTGASRGGSQATSCSDSPVNEGASSPVKSDTMSPVKSDTMSPVKSDTMSPVKSDTMSPVKSDTMSPVKGDTASPVKSNTTSRVKGDTASPVKSDTMSPVKSDSASPVKSDTASPVKSDNASPVKSDNASPVKSDNTSPVKSDSASPVKGDNASPVKEDTASPDKEEPYKDVYVLSQRPLGDESFNLSMPQQQGETEDMYDVIANQTQQLDETILGLEVPESPLLIIQTFKTSGDPLSLPQTLDELKPKFIVMYDVDITVIRRIEVYQALNPRVPVHVYFVVFGGSVEEQAYLTSLRREKEAFHYLIKEKATMVIPEDQDGKSDHCEALSRDTSKPSEVVNSRKGGICEDTTVKKASTIVVDMREFNSELPAMIHRRGIDVEPVTLQVGDYILSPDICVERKSVNDLIGSLNHGRLYNQAKAMTRYYASPILLIEFDQNKPMTLQGNYYISNDMSSNDVSSKLILLTLHFPQLRIVWSPSPFATAQLFEELKQVREEPNPIKAAEIGADLEQDLDIAEKFNPGIHDLVARMPGITTKNIHTLLNKGGTLDGLAALSKEELTKMLENSQDAESLYDAFHDKFKPVDTSEMSSKRGGARWRGRGRGFRR